MRKPPSPIVKFAVSALSLLLFTSYVHAAPQVQVNDLGHLPIPHEVAMSEAFDVSDNGKVVVGLSTFVLPATKGRRQTQQAAFRWTSTGGMQQLGYLASDSKLAAAHAVTPDGSITVGFSDGHSVDGRSRWLHATRWQANQPPQDLGTLLGGNESAAYSVCQQGKRIAGYSKNQQGKKRAVLWEPAAAPKDLGTLGGMESVAMGISHDGTYIVGAAYDVSQRSRAFVWTKTNGMKDLGTLPGTSAAHATAISADGNVIVGYSAQRIRDWITPLPEAKEPIKGVIWHRSSGRMQEITNTLGGLTTIPFGVSNDGQIVVGMAKDAHGEIHAFRWTLQSGMVIETALPDALQMSYARGLSNDGQYSVGRLTEDDSAFRAQWR